MLDDEMQLAADQLVGALRLEPGREPDFAIMPIVGDPHLQRRIIGAADGNACHVELGHGGEMGSRYEKASRSEEHTSELQSLMSISYAVFCLKKKNKKKYTHQQI